MDDVKTQDLSDYHVNELRFFPMYTSKLQRKQ